MALFLHEAGGGILADIPLPGQNSIEAQAEMFRLAKRDYGLTLRVIAENSPLKLSTLKGWCSGSAMPAWAIGALGEAGVPDHLLSLVYKPFGRHVGTTDAEACVDRIGELAIQLAQLVMKARDPNGPGQSAVVPQERVKIAEILDELQGLGSLA